VTSYEVAGRRFVSRQTGEGDSRLFELAADGHQCARAQVAALDDAVGVAIDWVHAHSSFDETLILLLADHETGALAPRMSPKAWPVNSALRVCSD